MLETPLLREWAPPIVLSWSHSEKCLLCFGPIDTKILGYAPEQTHLDDSSAGPINLMSFESGYGDNVTNERSLARLAVLLWFHVD